MKRIFNAALLLMFCITPCFANQVDVKLQTQIHNGTKGGARIPALRPNISADVTNGIITTSIAKYSGMVYIYVCDSEGNIVSDWSLNINDQTPYTLSLNFQDNGEYSIHYIIGDLQFEGEFSI